MAAIGNNHLRTILSCITLVIYFVLLTSCKGQDKSFPPADKPSDKKVRSAIKSADSFSPFNLYSGKTIPNEDILPLSYEGQLAHWIREIYQDKKGNLWFGTNHYGLVRFNGEAVEYITENHGINATRINEIVEDIAGNIWFATDGLGIFKYDGSQFINFSETDGLISNMVWSMTIDKNGIFWIGTLQGVSRFDGEVFTTFTLPQASIKDPKPILSHFRINKILEDMEGNLWFGTDGYGIARYDGKNFSHFTNIDGLPDNNISDLMEDSKGNIWIGTMYGGVSRYDGSSFINFTQNGTIDGVEVGGFYEDNHSNIWFAAENNGVYRYNGKSFTNFNIEQGLDTNGILSIFQDRQERFWFGGWKGLFRYNGTTFSPVTKEGPWAK